MSVFGILEERNPRRRAECGTWVMSQDGLWKLIFWLITVKSHICRLRNFLMRWIHFERREMIVAYYELLSSHMRWGKATKEFSITAVCRSHRRDNLPENSLTNPCSRVLLEKLTGSQLVNKFPTFYGTQKFITAFTNASQMSLSWARTERSLPPHSTTSRSMLILSSHLRLGLPSGHLISGLPNKSQHASVLSTPIYA